MQETPVFLAAAIEWYGIWAVNRSFYIGVGDRCPL